MSGSVAWAVTIHDNELGGECQEVNREDEIACLRQARKWDSADVPRIPAATKGGAKEAW